MADGGADYEVADIKRQASALIVDGDAVVRSTLADIFKKKGYHVRFVSTGDEAIQAIKDDSYNFAIISVHLPDMEGSALLEEIRKIDLKINCITITGYSNEKKQAGPEKRAKSHLAKPLNLDELIKILNR